MSSGRAFAILALVVSASAPGCTDDPLSGSTERFSEYSTRTTSVADSSFLEIRNFAGNLTLTPGDPNVVHLEIEKWARVEADLEGIEVRIEVLSDSVRVETVNPDDRNGVGVDIHATIPADLRPDLRCGAGEIDYTGRPRGETRFAAGAGTIVLRLPVDVDVELHLSVGAGTITVDFPVSGQVQDHSVDGVIGTGEDGSIVAQVGAGTILVERQ